MTSPLMRNVRPASLLAVVVALAGLLVTSSPSQACSCGPRPAAQRVPADGMVIPPNSRFVAHWESDDYSSVVVGSDGEEWPVELVRHGRLLLSAGDHDLDPGTYEWTLGPDTIRFDVSDDVVVDDQEPPVVTNVRPHPDNGDDFSGCPSPLALLYDATHDGIVEVVALEDERLDAADEFAVMRLAYSRIGTGMCSSNWNAAPGLVRFRVGAFDGMGRFVGWSDLVEADLPDPNAPQLEWPPEGGCQSMQTPSSTPTAALLLFAWWGGLLLRSRRRFHKKHGRQG